MEAQSFRINLLIRDDKEMVGEQRESRKIRFFCRGIKLQTKLLLNQMGERKFKSQSQSAIKMICDVLSSAERA